MLDGFFLLVHPSTFFVLFQAEKVSNGGAYKVQHSPDLRYHCVLKKHSIGRNSTTRGLFYVVNVLGYFKIA